MPKIDAHRARLASLLVVAAGSLWGLYWIPVRHLENAGWPGALGSIASAAVAGLVLAPALVLRKRAPWRGDWRVVAATMLGGAAFMLYSVALVEARVAVVILLFYLTPVWTTLIGRFVFKWPTNALRYIAIGLALAGLLLVLGRGAVLPLPDRAGEWYALTAGLLWSLASIGMSARGGLRPIDSSAVFVVGALITALLLFLADPRAPQPGAWPPGWRTLSWAVLSGVLWWILSMLGVVWAARHITPARLGILLMSEVLVGVVSAALFAGEALSDAQLFGGALVIGAAGLDVASDRLTPPRAAD